MGILNETCKDSDARLIGIEGDPNAYGFKISCEWQEVNPASADTCIVSLNHKKTVTNPLVDKQEYKGTFIRSQLQPIVTDQDHVNVRQLLTKVRTTCLEDSAVLFNATIYPQVEHVTGDNVDIPTAFVREWKYLQPTKLDAEIVRLKAVSKVTNPKVSGNTLSGNYFVGRTTWKTEDDATITIQQHLNDTVVVNFHDSIISNCKEIDEIWIRSGASRAQTRAFLKAYDTTYDVGQKRTFNVSFDEETGMYSTNIHATQGRLNVSQKHGVDVNKFDSTYSIATFNDTSSHCIPVAGRAALVKGNTYHAEVTKNDLCLYDKSLKVTTSAPVTVGPFKSAESSNIRSNSTVFKNVAQTTDTKDEAIIKLAAGEFGSATMQRNPDGTMDGTKTVHVAVPGSAGPNVIVSNKLESATQELVFMSDTNNPALGAATVGVTAQASVSQNELRKYDKVIRRSTSVSDSVGPFKNGAGGIATDSTAVFRNLRAADIAKVQLGAGQVGSSSYRRNDDGTIDGSRTIRKPYLKDTQADVKKSTLENTVEYIHINDTNPAISEASATGVTVVADVRMNELRRFDKNVRKTTSVVDSVGILTSGRSGHYVDNTVVLRNARADATLALTSGQYGSTSFRRNDDGTVDGTKTIRTGPSITVADHNVGSTALDFTNETLVFNDADENVGMSASKGTVVRANISLNDVGKYDKSIQQVTSVGDVIGPFKSAQTGNYIDHTTIYRNLNSATDTSTLALGSGDYGSTSIQRNMDGTMDGIKTVRTYINAQIPVTLSAPVVFKVYGIVFHQPDGTIDGPYTATDMLDINGASSAAISFIGGGDLNPVTGEILSYIDYNAQENRWYAHKVNIV